MASHSGKQSRKARGGQEGGTGVSPSEQHMLCDLQEKPTENKNYIEHFMNFNCMCPYWKMTRAFTHYFQTTFKFNLILYFFNPKQACYIISSFSTEQRILTFQMPLRLGVIVSHLCQILLFTDFGLILLAWKGILFVRMSIFRWF